LCASREQRLHCRFDGVEQNSRIDANRETDAGQQRDAGDLGPGDWGKGVSVLVLKDVSTGRRCVAEEGFLQGSPGVGDADDDADAGGGGPPGVGDPRSDEDLRSVAGLDQKRKDFKPHAAAQPAPVPQPVSITNRVERKFLFVFDFAMS